MLLRSTLSVCLGSLLVSDTLSLCLGDTLSLGGLVLGDTLGF